MRDHCYLDVDGHGRPRMADYMEAFARLAQGARQRVETEEPELQDSVKRDLTAMRDGLERDLEGHTREASL